MAAIIPANNYFWVSATKRGASFDLDAYVGRFGGYSGIDPALITFKQDLLDYLLCMIWGIPGARSLQDKVPGLGNTTKIHAFTQSQRDAITINRNLLYRHDTLYVQYTAYNGYPALGTVDRNQPDFMVHAFNGMGDATGEYGDYRFAQLIDIFHVLVRSPRTHRLHKVTMLFVRCRSPTSCPKRQQFLPADHPEAFGFLDPTQVIRPINVAPDFASGRTMDYLARSAIRTLPNNTDFKFYYINCMHDHDLFFRLHMPSAILHFVRALLSPGGHIDPAYYLQASPAGLGIKGAFEVTKSGSSIVEENALEDVDLEDWKGLGDDE